MKGLPSLAAIALFIALFGALFVRIDSTLLAGWK